LLIRLSFHSQDSDRRLPFDPEFIALSQASPKLTLDRRLTLDFFTRLLSIRIRSKILFSLKTDFVRSRGMFMDLHFCLCVYILFFFG